MKIGVPSETHPGEQRVAITPDVAGQLQKLGFSVAIESGAGASASFGDRRPTPKPALNCLEDRAELFSGSDIILKVRAPNDEELGLFRSGQVLISFLWAGPEFRTPRAAGAGGRDHAGHGQHFRASPAHRSSTH